MTVKTRTKRLKAETIIPRSLYVERAADRQLRTVIDDMGRPGYVLVARQMGKTNLLLHARDVLASEDDLFVYLDFSLPGESLREQLRSIIDAVISLRHTKLTGVAHEIRLARQNSPLPPHKEHENELRAILQQTAGKLVLIFDEIDALTNTNYSDHLFSLVRSIYFSRANFPEYGRLTYVLSGVAEPSELIKNKNISPFNIGEKIYLDEFTRTEVDDFLKKAELDLEASVRNRLFYWAAGNPRMTWDVCSAIEDELLAARPINEASVDAIIQRMYFGSVDRVPIDHIRKLVADQRDLREAVRQIRAGTGNIGDPNRAKLYLAGIISSDFDNSRPKLKNKIIDAALSDAWLEDVERRKRNALELARERALNKQYKEALNLFLEHLASVPERDDKSFLYYDIGICCFQEDRYSEAKEWFKKQPIDKQSSLGAYLEEVYFTGLSETYLEEHEAAVKSFQEIIDAQRSDAYYFLALVNQAVARFRQGGEQNIVLARHTLRTVVEQEGTIRTKMPEDEARKLQITARVNLGRLMASVKDYDDAIGQFEAALEQCMVHEKATILTSLITLERDAAQQLKRTREAREFVTSYKPVLAKQTASNSLAFDYFSMVQLYGFVALLEGEAERRAFGEYVRRQYFNDVNGDTEFTFAVASVALNVGNAEVARGELTELLSRTEAVASDAVKAAALRLILYRNRKPDVGGLRKQYLKLLENRPYAALAAHDLGVLIDEVGDLFGRSKFADALAVIGLANSYRSTSPAELLANFFVIDYFNLLVSAQIGELDKAKQLARELKTIDVEALAKTARLLVAPEDLRMIRTQASRVLELTERRPQARNPYAGIGKNDLISVQYADGRTVRKKFKHLRADLEAGRCRIVN